MSKITVLGSMCALAGVLSSGCVMKQTVLKRDKVVIDKGTNHEREVECSYPSTEDEYTLIGNGVNTVLGTVTGFVNCGLADAKRGYNNTTNGIPIIWPSMNAGFEFLKGSTVGAAEGAWEGWNATYEEVREQNKKSNTTIDQIINEAIKTISFERD